MNLCVTVCVCVCVCLRMCVYVSVCFNTEKSLIDVFQFLCLNYSLRVLNYGPSAFVAITMCYSKDITNFQIFPSF